MLNNSFLRSIFSLKCHFRLGLIQKMTQNRNYSRNILSQLACSSSRSTHSTIRRCSEIIKKSSNIQVMLTGQLFWRITVNLGTTTIWSDRRQCQSLTTCGSTILSFRLRKETNSNRTIRNSTAQKRPIYKVDRRIPSWYRLSRNMATLWPSGL